MKEFAVGTYNNYRRYISVPIGFDEDPTQCSDDIALKHMFGVVPDVFL